MEMIKNNSTATQRLFILQQLRKRPHSTLDFRNFGICSPASRIIELRKKGFEISTTFTTETDHSGVTHKNIAIYELISEPKEVVENEQ